MYCTTLVRSKARGIGDGLTYDAGDEPVAPGTLVRVPLRKQKVEGIVLDVSVDVPKSDFTVKAIESMLGPAPLLTRPQILTLRWMAQYYDCSLRQALSVFLPPGRWSTLLRQKNPVVQTDAGRRMPLSAHWTPTPLQRAAVEAIASDPRPTLLFGVTGSGKTAVYAELVARTAGGGRQSILLLPEILLSEHALQRFETFLDPAYIAILHSGMSARERRETWRKIQRGDVWLVIGSRSALFAPCPQLGLIVIDEEHEWTYKNEQAPRYHARETAEILAAASGATLVLGSATPSLESWARTKEGPEPLASGSGLRASRYHLVRLPERYAQHPPARVRVIDLGAVRFGKHYPFSPPLIDAIRERLKRGEQSVLFLNRRGMASSLLCRRCRRRVVSPSSQLPYTVHRTGGRPFLLDHSTGETQNVPPVCPSCGSADLAPIGAGTQRLEDILVGFFPEARVLRADSDALTHPEQMRWLLAAMEERRADILIGTQSVVKGLHLPGVTLAAVLIADIGLSLPHFRAGERVFQLLMQLTGRSGREESGDVIIQTFRPDAAEIIAAASGKTEEYLDKELAARTRFDYPPATAMIRLVITGADAAARAKKLHSEITQIIARDALPVRAFSAPTLFGGGRVWHVLLRGRNPRAALTSLDRTDVAIDIDPLECM